MQWILRAAYENDASGGEADLLYAEIKTGYFKMPAIHPARSEESQWGHVFKKSKLENYGAVSATISRAARRLAKRGLVTISRSRAGKYPPARCELRLTEQGWVVAKALFDASNCHKRAGSAK